ncbi:prophage protein [Weissella oryzae SG25]|uniref:Prophage protein n=1 Tax=Weissella oryzae (strain DSM 25784 / JCM 18191 / LMG 30913 / SG25) TaxID=1329250 RepID=A0A069D3M9_WEIOS|nr:HK97-gp10 family putative phage morphogenesis protein [Weissella oryzae]GAK32001.1 prophage protein [Weissella oryzae SG25]
MSKSGMKVTFKGVDNLITKYDKQPQKIKDEATDIINNTAQQVEKKAVELAPVDTGYLKQHIKAENNGLLSAKIISSANYSIYLEKGTRRMPPQPFMQPAVSSQEDFLHQKLSNLLKRGLL